MVQVQQNIERASTAGSLDGMYAALLDGQGNPITTNQSDSVNPKLVDLNPQLEPVPLTPNPKTGKFLPYTYETTIDEMVSVKSPKGIQREAHQVPGMAYVLPFWVDAGYTVASQPAIPEG